MLFIHPMWSSESERIGKQKCTPWGFALHVIADLIGMVGLFILLASPAVLVSFWFAGTLCASDFWLLAMPFGIGAVSEVLFQFSWWLARRKGFHFNYELDEASWEEAGERRSYKYPA